MRILPFVILLAWPVAVSADQAEVQVNNVWSRAATAGHQGVVYLTITDTGPPDKLIGVTTPVAAKAELHQSFDDNGVMKMRPVASLPIEPGKPATLAPGGYHIMLTDLKQTLKPGDSFSVTLKFATAGQITATATVAKPGASMHGTEAMPQHMTMPMHESDKQP
ncbi:MAG TPA: copper chaperone PCu(A)C [Acetobacteraceae bacterium]|nr:copper chaperone PCu(A)C [Acetobacteraceae bacterium]